MKRVLVELVVHWLCDWVVMCLNLVGNKSNFLFAKIPFGMEMKRQSNPSCQERQPNVLRDIL